MLRRYPKLLWVLAVTSAAWSRPAIAAGEGSIQVNGTTVTAGVGWEHLEIANVEFGGKYDFTTAPFPLVEPNEQHDGGFNGVRVDVAVESALQLPGLPHALIGVKGFHAWHNDPSVITCFGATAAAACDGVSIFDPSPAANNTLNSGVGETATYVTEREVRHWGGSVEVAPAGGKDAILQHRVEIGYRTVDQDLALTSTWSLSPNRQQYDESLETDYLGVYAGLGSRHGLTDSLVAAFDAEGGVYWARTDYRGALNQRDLAGALFQVLELDRGETAFIGALNFSLEQRFRVFTLAGFARGEYYSYAPEMAYNQTDRDSGFVGGFSLSGPNDGTRIDDDDAWSVTLGGRIDVPLGSAD